MFCLWGEMALSKIILFSIKTETNVNKTLHHKERCDVLILGPHVYEQAKKPNERESGDPQILSKFYLRLQFPNTLG